MQLLGSHMKGLEARMASCSQVHIDKHKLAALNTPQLLWLLLNFDREMVESYCTIWLQLFFKILMQQPNLFITKQMSLAWPKELCRQIPAIQFSECHKEQIKPCSRVLFIYTLHHTQPSAFISALY